MTATILGKPLCLSCQRAEEWLTAQGFTITKISMESTAAMVLLAELDLPIDETLELPVIVVHGWPSGVDVKVVWDEPPELPAGT